jgi:hypothetical protein
MDGRVFGHWDITHERLDAVRASPTHVRNQIRNELAGQQADGLIPGLISFGVTGHPGLVATNNTGQPTWKSFKGFPPLWVMAVDAYVAQTADRAMLGESLAALRKQIGWFESKRRVPGGGFYYLDITTDTWESGVDEGVRFLERPASLEACVDATAHVYLLYEHAARWSRELQQPAAPWEAKANALREFIRQELWDSATGFFYDHWTVRRPERRRLTFEGMWPVVVGAATPDQARRVCTPDISRSVRVSFMCGRTLRSTKRTSFTDRSRTLAKRRWTANSRPRSRSVPTADSIILGVMTALDRL